MNGAPHDVQKLPPTDRAPQDVQNVAGVGACAVAFG